MPPQEYHGHPHGVANAILLPTVMDYNKEYTGEKYRDIAKAMGVAGVDEMTLDEARTAAVDAVRQLGKDVGIPSTLTEVGFKEEDIELVAKDALNDVCTGGNPRDTNVEEIIELYRSLL